MVILARAGEVWQSARPVWPGLRRGRVCGLPAIGSELPHLPWRTARGGAHRPVV